MNITLDGYMAALNGGLDWHFPYWSEEMAAYSLEQLRGIDTILLGRLTYQKMAAYWPYAPAGEYAGIMNQYRKIVFSRSLHQARWHHTTVVSDNIGTEIRRLKQQPGQHMIVYGSASITRLFIRLGLVDEYQLWVHPVLLHQGVPLFNTSELNLELLQTKPFRCGVVLFHLRPA